MPTTSTQSLHGGVHLHLHGPASENGPMLTSYRLFSRESGFSATELADLLRSADDPSGWVSSLLSEANRRRGEHRSGDELQSLILPRMMHALGSAVLQVAGADDTPLADVFPGLQHVLAPDESAWFETLGLLPGEDVTAGSWAGRARSVAFDYLKSAIVFSGARRLPGPAARLRSDEIIWGRAPARLDLCGGWTDTPPYALEFGGCVLNAAVDLNGQPPIQAFARVIEQPVIHIASIDRGTRIEISRLDQLLDYREVASEFSLAKAALAMSSLAPESIADPRGTTLRQVLDMFGGGVELTTLAAIPKGSGLGTSSIMGAVVLAVLDRVQGRSPLPKALFHRVLQLEQALTTGGGWQDQVGGVMDGVKLVTSPPGIVPNTVVEFVPGNVLEPAENGGQTLLYYTGITRLAKNILSRVVGRYLDRDPLAMSTLAELRSLAPQAASAMSRRDFDEFGRFVDAAWQLNKRLDPDSSNQAIEAILARLRPNIIGAKLLGAGGGGFLLLVCKSPEAASQVRTDLEENPPNRRARFFQFNISREGLRVTAC